MARLGLLWNTSTYKKLNFSQLAKNSKVNKIRIRKWIKRKRDKRNNQINLKLTITKNNRP
jgi:hypothetical protein